MGSFKKFLLAVPFLAVSYSASAAQVPVLDNLNLSSLSLTNLSGLSILSPVLSSVTAVLNLSGGSLFALPTLSTSPSGLSGLLNLSSLSLLNGGSGLAGLSGLVPVSTGQGLLGGLTGILSSGPLTLTSLNGLNGNALGNLLGSLGL
jgi:hypothetical protein